VVVEQAAAVPLCQQSPRMLLQRIRQHYL
jgi:hypothetical protein